LELISIFKLFAILFSSHYHSDDNHSFDIPACHDVFPEAATDSGRVEKGKTGCEPFLCQFLDRDPQALRAIALFAGFWATYSGSLFFMKARR
jgi:hypothetical protein